MVTKNVAYYGVIVGVPANQKGWMGRHGHILRNPDENGIVVCPESGLRYKDVKQGTLKCIDLDEEASLPDSMKTGKQS